MPPAPAAKTALPPPSDVSAVNSMVVHFLLTFKMCNFVPSINRNMKLTSDWEIPTNMVYVAQNPFISIYTAAT